MAARLTLSIGTLYGFLLVLARVAGVFVFGGLPMSRNSPAAARLAFSVVLTFTLVSYWPVVEVSFSPPALEVCRLAGRLLAETGLGAAMGLVIALLGETLLIAAQVLGLQAGYSYASTIDPNSEADSGVLLALAQIAAWMLFIAFGLERLVIRALAVSLENYPAGGFWFSEGARQAVLTLGHAVLDAGIRLALPVVALLLLIDLAFALLGKLHTQLQLLALAFPVKMLVALLMLAGLARIFPKVYEGVAGQASGALMQLAGT
jgi:flagellar biosynthesis protein FliR